tara:strand:+ start:751 stop:1338 length:588 start_codon:yes stop_codon:yes gene_type:complete
MAKYTTKNLERYLNSLGRNIVKKARKNLSDANKGGGNLSRSLDFKVKRKGRAFSVQLFMADYGKFVDEGVKGAGGEIKTGKHAGSYGGRRHYITWEKKRKDSPFQFGSGKSSGSIYTGIEAFIKKKGIKGRDRKGRFITNKSLAFAIVKVLWIKGIHGISFFQQPLGFYWRQAVDKQGLLGAVADDIITNIKKAI